LNQASFIPRVVAWEITRQCNLNCLHCRASAEDIEYSGELTTEECRTQVDELVKLGTSTLILTGGEPLMRADAFDIATYATGRGLRTVMAVNGTLLTPAIAQRMKESGITHISISLDFPTAAGHDHFRGEPGAFEGALAGIRTARAAGIGVQINTTITRLNVAYLDDMLGLALDVGAVAFHPFLLVPTGRGKTMADQELSPEDYERTLHWIYDRQRELQSRIFFKPTDAPHYLRVVRQRASCEDVPISTYSHREQGAPAGHGGPGGLSTLSRGCLAGIGFMFISHVGDVQGCGYLSVVAGNVRRQPLSTIWHESTLFNHLRRFDDLKGKCGRCEYRHVCGGCRARAYEATGDYMAEEPYCVYQPRRDRADADVGA
jgi:AdoMet-dependent heme synthase